MTEDEVQPTGLRARIAAWARQLRRDAVALWMVCRDPRTPLWIKLYCGGVVAYALSPIDLIPDVIPILGYVDEMLLLPAMIWIAVRIIPAPLMEDGRARAQDWLAAHGRRPSSLVGAAVIVVVWCALAWLAWRWWSR